MNRWWNTLYAFVVACGLAAPDVSAQTTEVLGSLYVVTVQIDPTAPSGTLWDTFDNSAPDPVLEVRTGGGTTYIQANGAVSGRAVTGCRNSHICRFARVYLPPGSVLHVYDADPFGSLDDVGGGQCFGTCRLGNARVWVVPFAQDAARRAVEEEQANTPQSIELHTVRSLLLGQHVNMVGGNVWTFEPTEPFHAQIVSQQATGRRSVVTANITTSAVDGTQSAGGSVRLTLFWTAGQPRLESVQAASFALR